MKKYKLIFIEENDSSDQPAQVLYKAAYQLSPADEYLSQYNPVKLDIFNNLVNMIKEKIKE